MPPRKRQKGLAKGATTIKWDEQPEVEGGTFETPYGFRLQTRECPPTGGVVQRAQIGRLDDNGSWEKLLAKCSVSIGNADNRDIVLETYQKHYDDETMEAAAAEQEEQGRTAVEAVVAASDEMGLRGGRVAQPKSDAPSTDLSNRAQAKALTNRRNLALRAYYASHAKVVYDRSNGGTVIIERLGGGSAGRLSCVSELGAVVVPARRVSLVAAEAKGRPPGALYRRGRVGLVLARGGLVIRSLVHGRGRLGRGVDGHRVLVHNLHDVVRGIDLISYGRELREASY